MGRLDGKVAIVTGATSGMGRSIAELFAEEGASVVVGGRNHKRGAQVVRGIIASGGKAEFVSSDVSTYEGNESLVKKAAEAFDGVDILALSAGILGIGKITELPLETWQKTINTNLASVFYIAKSGIPEMKKRGGGQIVVVGSIASQKAFPGHPAYCASKSGLVSLVKQIALDYGPEIRINLLAPGQVDTPLLWDSAKNCPGDPEAVIKSIAEKMPTKRIGLPEDIAKAALFLATDDSSWITGAEINIDGGIMCGGA